MVSITSSKTNNAQSLSAISEQSPGAARIADKDIQNFKPDSFGRVGNTNYIVGTATIFEQGSHSSREIKVLAFADIKFQGQYVAMPAGSTPEKILNLLLSKKT